MSKRKQKPKTPEPAIKVIANRLRALADEADRKRFLLDSKAKYARQVYDNGASLESVSEKLDWPVSKLVGLLEPETDIDIRTLSDMWLAIGREVHFKAGDRP